ncbi:LOW QUALITY PROTEIN: C-type lectin domain family 2 member E-like [Arvicola amphibius]|uniref:LOW QUALITY PROTEIN: C-type lectin domain family 2 member E-like n=1 Tax=Arvicola amphibius TaxID=1047088 RepID=UPI001C0920F8|nr:LOW QUALITY PROTEIN: C-type lectin domain family 2 member E-like [Arvicola amphibius]
MSEDLSGLSIKRELQEMTAVTQGTGQSVSDSGLWMSFLPLERLQPASSSGNFVLSTLVVWTFAHLLTWHGKKLQGECPRIVFPVSPARLYCCYAVIIVLTGAVVGLSVALSLSVRKEEKAIASPEAGCPKDWIGFGSKCFYFSEHTSNWTSSLTSCMELGAHLTHFDSLEELNFLRRYRGGFCRLIGLHRESSEHPWMWTDNTEYNNLVPIRGEGEHAYLSDSGISSGRSYLSRKWICSKPNNYTFQCPVRVITPELLQEDEQVCIECNLNLSERARGASQRKHRGAEAHESQLLRKFPVGWSLGFSDSVWFKGKVGREGAVDAEPHSSKFSGISGLWQPLLD